MSLLLVQVNAASRVPLFELAEWSDFAPTLTLTLTLTLTSNPDL